MNRHQMFNPANYQADPTKNMWLLSTRNEVLDYYEAEMIKPKYLPGDDNTMLTMLGKHIKELKKNQAKMPWEALVREVAEGLLEIDEWSTDHYDIEEILMEKSK
jgi:hypothetical protein